MFCNLLPLLNRVKRVMLSRKEEEVCSTCQSQIVIVWKIEHRFNNELQTTTLLKIHESALNNISVVSRHNIMLLCGRKTVKSGSSNCQINAIRKVYFT